MQNIKLLQQMRQRLLKAQGAWERDSGRDSRRRCGKDYYDRPSEGLICYY